MAITKIATIEVGAGGAASIDFTSIPGTYTDLMVVTSLRSSSSGIQPTIAFNGVQTSQTHRWLYGDGAAPTSSNNTSIWTWMNASTWTSNTFSNSSMYIPNYAGSTNKSISIDGVTENNATSAYGGINAGLWASGAAITSISILPQSSNIFAQYSSASLYGILKGSSGGVTVS